MPLELNSRLIGNVHVIECKGRIVAGPEAQVLEAALRQDWARNIHRVVLRLAEVNVLDSMGLGLLVRNMSTLRKRGGDLRLADVSPFILEVLRVTRMDAVLKVFPSEQEAILSFLTAQAEPQGPRPVNHRVLLVDQSPDFCAFAAAALGQHDHDVMSVSLVGDARILLQVYKVDTVLIGPSTRPEAVDTITSTLKSLAPAARVLRIDPALKSAEPHHATQALLGLLETNKQ